jgi:hypothetical protein
MGQNLFHRTGRSGPPWRTMPPAEALPLDNNQFTGGVRRPSIGPVRKNKR